MYDSLILGNGYCGSRIFTKSKNSAITSRTPKNEHMIHFELSDKSTWKNLPHAHTVIWTFSCKGLSEELEFYQYLKTISKQVIIYSTTSVYKHSVDQEIITESTALDFDKVRLRAEEKIRLLGANIFTLCGIFGPQRDPKNWLLKGLIKSPDKVVNLIHIDDIIELTFLLAKKNFSSCRINLCTGKNDEWQDLAKHYNYEFPRSTNKQAILRKTIKSEVLDDLLDKNHPFLRATDFSSLN
ncbi:hypothetical protein PQO03_03565 [Lentisphaera profundi]|uniref:NAD-dependent epimerase/dehydratase domain-containing protein n=1 Tax=Lentisphaera profundi TaxID=1658616 RepID=A0ABY7VUQ8_9BACT|nr:hypothetical protein [Lentisphaera profundi]WDE97034.1 hypothetical protein PQO03_03565 [Lentisphaera profundi]